MATYEQLSKYNWKAYAFLGYEEGKKKMKRKQGFKTKTEAKAWAEAIENKAKLGYLPTMEADTLFKDYIMKWYEDFKKPSLSINTRNDYSARIEAHIIPMLGNYKLKDINNIVIQDFYNSLIKDKGMKAISAKKVFDIVNGCFKYAKKLKIIPELPTDIEKQKAEKPMIKYWKQEEADYYLLANKDKYLYTPVLIALLTGVRIGELLGLKYNSFDFDKGLVDIHHQVVIDKATKRLVYTDILKTSSSYRTITVPNILIDHLKALKESTGAGDNDFIIEDRNGGLANPRNVSMNFVHSLRKYSYNPDEKKNKENYKQLRQISFHDLRHTHATLLMYNNENIKVISKRLGHKNIKTTLDRYAEVLDEMEAKTADLLDRMFSNLR